MRFHRHMKLQIEYLFLLDVQNDRSYLFLISLYRWPLLIFFCRAFYISWKQWTGKASRCSSQCFPIAFTPDVNGVYGHSSHFLRYEQSRRINLWLRTLAQRSFPNDLFCIVSHMLFWKIPLWMDCLDMKWWRSSSKTWTTSRAETLANTAYEAPGFYGLKWNLRSTVSSSVVIGPSAGANDWSVEPVSSGGIIGKRISHEQSSRQDILKQKESQEIHYFSLQFLLTFINK